MQEDKLEEKIKEKLEDFRKKALDTSKRNPLINFQSRSYSVQVHESDPKKALDVLIHSNESDGVPLVFDHHEGNGSQRSSLVIKQDELNAVKNLRKRAGEYARETGINTAFLATCFISWKDNSDDDREYDAPLLLIPIKVRPSNSQSGYCIEYTDDPIENNIPFVEKIEQGSLNSGNGILRIKDHVDFVNGKIASDYFEKVESLCSNKGWKLHKDSCYISCFEMNGLSIHEDLKSENWIRENSELKERVLLNKNITNLFYSEQDKCNRPDSATDSNTLANVHHVVDIDKTQRRALHKISSKTSFVIKGPPGTGKSQTITNIISSAVCSGKTVLFVTEKLAALEVVKNKMDKLNLGNIVLELHRDKTKKQAFFKTLRETIEGPSIKELQSPQRLLEKMKILRKELDNYDQSYKEEVKGTGVSPCHAIKEIIRIKERLTWTDLEHIDIKEIGFWSKEKFDRARTRFKKYSTLIDENGSPKKSCFYECMSEEYLDQTEFLRFNNKIASLESKINEFSSAYENYKKKGMPNIGSLLDIDRMLTTISILEKNFKKTGYRYSSSAWVKSKNEIQSMVKLGENLKKRIAVWNNRLKDGWLDKNYSHDKKILERYEGKWVRIITPKYWILIFHIKKCYLKSGYSPESYKEDISEIANIQRERSKLLECRLATEVMSTKWRGEKTDWEEFKDAFNDIEKMCNQIDKGEIDKAILKIIDSSSYSEYSNPQENSLTKLAMDVKISIKDIQKKIKFYINRKVIESGSIWNCNFDNITEMVSSWNRNPSEFKFIIEYNRLSKYFNNLGLSKIIINTLKENVTAGDMVDYLDLIRYTAVLDRAKTQFGTIIDFDSLEYDEKIKRFQEYEQLEIKYNIGLVQEAHRKKIQKYNSTRGNKLVEYIHAKNKPSIREAFLSCGKEIQTIKPIVMMSPLSISRYMAPDSVCFDLVVFDEASQIKPEYALGGIFRGKQTIVVGDNKQLPPTNFFANIISDDHEEEYQGVDYESVLDWFLGKGYDQEMLKWHYRSEHESLIAISNKEFYDSKLAIVPSANFESDEKGLKFSHLPECKYDRGNTRANIGEAKHIAKMAIRHAQQHPELSLGVVAFSKSQKDAIEQQLEIIRKTNRSFENFFESDQFFIKNLETVQGNEMDVVFVSVGYGKDEFGKLTRNFGPINKHGGEKRLNVIMTRAKRKCEIFSNFRHIDLSEVSLSTHDQNRGVNVLCEFLRYAETGRLSKVITGRSERDFDSPFELQVYKEIEKMGYKVSSQVGTCGFFIDLAVHCPNQSGKYALGIECDGASYHGTDWAKNRDRIRQMILEKNEWDIYRIWSTNWFSTQIGEIEKLKRAIEEAIRYRCECPD